MTYMDRTGAVISQERWEALMKADGYSVIAKDTIGDIRIRTKWQGYDKRNDPPRIFETTILGDRDNNRDKGITWLTEEEAIAGHNHIVTRYRLRNEAELSGTPKTLSDGIL